MYPKGVIALVDVPLSVGANEAVTELVSEYVQGREMITNKRPTAMEMSHF